MPRNTRVSARRRAAAISTLAAVIEDPNAPTHARVAASRALLNADRPEAGEEESESGAEPRPAVILPANGRETIGPRYANREAAEKAASEGVGGILVFDHPEAAAARAQMQARSERRRALAAAAEPLALPAPA